MGIILSGIEKIANSISFHKKICDAQEMMPSHTRTMQNSTLELTYQRLFSVLCGTMVFFTRRSRLSWVGNLARKHILFLHKVENRSPVLVLHKRVTNMVNNCHGTTVLVYIRQRHPTRFSLSSATAPKKMRRREYQVIGVPSSWFANN